MEKRPIPTSSKPDIVIAVSNERVRLTANWINGVAVATFAVGALAPAFALLYGAQQASLELALGIAICIVASIALHYWARRSLKDIRQ